MEQALHRVRLSFATGVGEPPTLIDLTLQYDPSLVAARDLESFIQWTLENDAAPRETVDVPKLNQIAPVQVYKRSIVQGAEDDKSCVICCENFRPRMHVRRLPCGHLFCAKCIAKWVVKQSATCPTCRCSLV